MSEKLCKDCVCFVDIDDGDRGICSWWTFNLKENATACNEFEAGHEVEIIWED